MWNKTKLEEVSNKIAMGPFGSNIKVSTFVNEGVPIISGAHLHGNRVIDGDNKFITEEHAKKLKNSNVFRGDVIFTHAGNIGQVAYIPENSKYDRYVISQRQFYLRCNKSMLLPEFITLYFHTQNGRNQLLANASQVGVPSIARPSSYLKSLSVPIPSLLEQKKIVSVIELLDDKIEHNRQMNETLENMARIIFKSWFIDFDPVHAKAGGNSPAHMDDETAALFPNSFGDDGLPAGWNNKTLGDVCKIISGKRPPIKKSTPDKENKISVYGGNGIAWYTNKVLFEPSFIITGRVGTLGTVYRVYEKCWVSDNALCCFPNNEDEFELIYFVMKEIDYQSLNSGSTQPLLTQTALKSQKIITPTKKVVASFHQSTKILFNKILDNNEENKTLAELRDTLLPKLMSGEIRVKDAEREVEAAL